MTTQIFPILLSSVVITYVCHGQNSPAKGQVRLPPSIISFDNSPVVRPRDSEVTVGCEAIGEPKPHVEWWQNGKRLEISGSREFSVDQNGALKIMLGTPWSQGYFQCKASNVFGGALSQTAYIRYSTIGTYPDKNVEEIRIKEGESLTIRCKPLEGYPTLTSTWSVSKDVNSVEDDSLSLGKRISMDGEGNLYFSAVEKLDERMKGDEHWIYKCTKKNRFEDRAAGGSYTRLVVDPADPDAEIRPAKVQFWSAAKTQTPAEGEEVVAIEGESMELRCIFSGSPVPNINDWRREDGRLIDRERIDYKVYTTEYKRRLIITRVEKSDSGTYICTGSNQHGKDEKRISIIVKSKPTFKEEGELISINKTIGEDAVFSCDTEADPKADITWFLNGDPLNVDDHQRMKLSSDRTQLTVERVCKVCTDGSRPTDLMVFQCNASNEYGYVFANGYLNVLEETLMVLEDSDPSPNIKVAFGNTSFVDNVTLPCRAISDPSTPVTFRWLFDDARLPFYPPAVTLMEDNALFINLDAVSDDEKEKYTGEYRCIASNGYSEDERSYTLQVTKNDKIVIVVADSTWIIVIICLIIFFLLMILLCCCCYHMSRNAGEEYPVDEIERKRGNDPIKELDDNGYHEFQRPIINTDTLKRSRAGFGSRASLASKRTLDDEEGLLGDGYLGPGTFNEDGSFIGQYNTGSRSKKM